MKTESVGWPMPCKDVGSFVFILQHMANVRYSSKPGNFAGILAVDRDELLFVDVEDDPEYAGLPGMAKLADRFDMVGSMVSLIPGKSYNGVEIHIGGDAADVDAVLSIGVASREHQRTWLFLAPVVKGEPQPWQEIPPGNIQQMEVNMN